MAKILLVGDICAETQYFVDTIPTTTKLGLVTNINHLTSSKIINAGRMLTSDNEVVLFGAVGKDDRGQQALRDLKKYRIQTNFVYSGDKPTDEVLVLTDSLGNTAIATYICATTDLDTTKIENISEYAYIYTSTVLPLFQLYLLIDKAHKNNVGIFLDLPNQQKALDKKFLQNVGFVVPNRYEAELLLDVKIPNIDSALSAVSELKKYTNGNAIITLDKDGCVVFGKDWSKPEHFQNPKVIPVDTAGAGDIFRGVLLREFIRTNSLEKSIQKALRIASDSTRIKGVENSIAQSLQLLLPS